MILSRVFNPLGWQVCVRILGKVTALGVLCCFALFVCLILLASFFLPSHLSFKNMYLYVYIIMHGAFGLRFVSCSMK